MFFDTTGKSSLSYSNGQVVAQKIMNCPYPDRKWVNLQGVETYVVESESGKSDGTTSNL